MRHDALRCTRCPLPADDGGGGGLTEDLQGTGGEGGNSSAWDSRGSAGWCRRSSAIDVRDERGGSGRAGRPLRLCGVRG